jgi:hypothetical protein
MALSTDTNRVDYVGVGTLDTYTYPFRIFDETDLHLVLTDTSGFETTLLLNTDYTVTGVLNSSGTVVLATDLPTGYGLAIMRQLPITQETHFRNQGPFFPERHEDAFDRAAMISQQLQEQIDRALVLPEGSTGIDNALPSPDPGYLLGWNGAGTALVNLTGAGVGLQTDLGDTSDGAKGDALLGVKVTYSGGAARTQHARNQEFVSIEDFGAVPNSAGAAAANTIAIHAAINCGKKNILISDVYYFQPPIQINTDGIRLYGDGLERSRLIATATAANAIEIAQGANVEVFEMVGINLVGNSTNYHGLLLGDNTSVTKYYAVKLNIIDCKIGGFTRTGYAGICARRTWWINISGTYIRNNYHAFYEPDDSSVTTVLIHSWSRISFSTNDAIKIGTAADATVHLEQFCLKNCDISGSVGSAIKSYAGASKFILDNVYFEDNVSDASSYLFYINGGSASYKFTKLRVYDCTCSSLASNRLLYADYAEITLEHSIGMTPSSNAAITAAANSFLHLKNLRLNASQDVIEYARTLTCIVEVDDINLYKGRFIKYGSHGNIFDNHFRTYQKDPPTIVVGLGAGSLASGAAAALSADATDTCGQITITMGSSGYQPVAMATVTFNKPYSKAPIVVFFPASAKASAQMVTLHVQATATTDDFKLDINVADSTTGTAVWNYIVME